MGDLRRRIGISRDPPTGDIRDLKFGALDRSGVTERLHWGRRLDRGQGEASGVSRLYCLRLSTVVETGYS